MGKCKKCGCTGFFWNVVSAGQKWYSGTSSSVNLSYKGVGIQGSVKGMSPQDNKSDQVAYRNCTCGHHYNYH